MTGRLKSDRQKFCFECGEIIVRHAEFCPLCGAIQQYNEAENNEPGARAGPEYEDEAKSRAVYRASDARHKNRLAASLLAIFLGGFGAHRFYLGQYGLGFLSLCFFWSGIPGIIGIAEGLY